MRCASAQINRTAITAIGHWHNQRATLMADANLGAATQPWVPGAHAPVLIGLAAVGDATVIPAVVDRGCNAPAMAFAVMRKRGALNKKGQREQSATDHLPSTSETAQDFGSSVYLEIAPTIPLASSSLKQ